MHNLYVSALKYSLPNLHKSQYPQNYIEFDNDMSFAQFSFEIPYNKDDI